MTFCIAPFVNVHVNPVGIVKPCCLFKGSDIIRTPNEAFYSKDWDEIRSRMLSDEILPECESCDNDKTAIGFFEDDFPTYRDWFNHRYKFDGAFEIKSVDLSRSNKCNFKCIICGWDRSSLWYETEKEVSKIVPRLDVPIASDARVMPDIVGEKEISVDVDEIDFTQVDNIALLGGEPLIDKKIYKILDDVKINSHLFISTNCSVSPLKIPIDKFKSVVINISIDGLNNVGEDVRYGLNTKRFMKNLNEWITLSKNHEDFKIRYHYVLHNLNAYNSKETEQILLSTGHGKFSLDVLKYPRYLSPRILPEEINIPVKVRNRKFNKKECINFIKFIDYMKTKQDFHTETLKIYDILKTKIKL